MRVNVTSALAIRLAMLGVIILVVLVVLAASAYTLDETEQAVIIQFGKPVGEAVIEPGLHFKLPFIQEVRRIDNRILAWDGSPNQINTRAREFISVESTARWRIVNPLKFLTSVTDEMGAQSRLDDIIDSAVRDRVSSMDLVEIVRSKNWHVDEEKILRARISEKERKILNQAIQFGREGLERDIVDQAQKLMPNYGIELVDVLIHRLNYVPSVQKQVFERMISERQRVAEEFRSQGKGRSVEIQGQTQKQVAVITSEARRKAEVIRGEAQAQAAKIYNEAYGSDPSFYAFYRTLESYGRSIGPDTTLIISSDTPYFRLFRQLEPK